VANLDVVSIAKSALNTPYVWGGTEWGRGLDCSGFVQQAYAKAGISIPRTTEQQFKTGQAVNLKNLQPGDLVFTEPEADGPGHVGMYVGNGTIQESPHTGDVNKYIPLNNFLADGYVGSRRYGASGSPAAPGGAPAGPGAQVMMPQQNLANHVVAKSTGSGTQSILSILAGGGSGRR
jgi:hypothetical protein